jgi:hypothetical protein
MYWALDIAGICTGHWVLQVYVLGIGYCRYMYWALGIEGIGTGHWVLQVYVLGIEY